MFHIGETLFSLVGNFIFHCMKQNFRAMETAVVCKAFQRQMHKVCICFLIIILSKQTIIRKTKNSSFKNEKSKKEVDVTITVSNKDIV